MAIGTGLGQIMRSQHCWQMFSISISFYYGICYCITLSHFSLVRCFFFSHGPLSLSLSLSLPFPLPHPRPRCAHAICMLQGPHRARVRLWLRNGRRAQRAGADHQNGVGRQDPRWRLPTADLGQEVRRRGPLLPTDDPGTETPSSPVGVWWFGGFNHTMKSPSAVRQPS